MFVNFWTGQEMPMYRKNQNFQTQKLKARQFCSHEARRKPFETLIFIINKYVKI